MMREVVNKNKATNIKNMTIEKEKHCIKNINSLKDTEYSSIYSLVAFLTSIILLHTNAFMEIGKTKYLVEFVVLCGMVVICHVLNVSARKKCEGRAEKNRSGKSSLLVKWATNIGYLNPVVCFVGWLVTIKEMDFGLKIFLLIITAVVVFFAINIPLFKHMEKNNK